MKAMIARLSITSLSCFLKQTLKHIALASFSIVLLQASASAQTPQVSLFKAINRVDIPKMEELLRSQDVSPDTRRRVDGYPAFFLAADKAGLSAVKVMLDHGANPNIATRDRGETLLMRRSAAGDVPAVKMLLAYKADPDRADIAQETALMKAVRSRKYSVAKLLLDAGSDPNVQDLTGKTALEYAKLSRSRRMIGLLQDAGALY